MVVRVLLKYLELLLSLLVQGDADGSLPLPLGACGGLPLGDAAALQGGAHRFGLSPVLRLLIEGGGSNRRKFRVCEYVRVRWRKARRA